MAQAGIHGLMGFAMSKLHFKKEWLLVGVIIGNILPDLDAVVVAYYTLMGRDTIGLHRTWSHSVPFIAGLVLIIYIILIISKNPRIGNFGIGLGVGMLGHVLLDMVTWFRGVQLFWPFYQEINFWQSFMPPEWWHNKFEFALEFGMMALYLFFLSRFALKHRTDIEYLSIIKTFIWLELFLFITFLILVYTWSGFYFVFGGVYIFSLLLILYVTIRMRKTIETIC